MKNLKLFFCLLLIVPNLLYSQIYNVDTTFNGGNGNNTSIISSMAMQSDGKIIICGPTSYNGVTINRLARLNPDGTLDTSFNYGSGPSASVGNPYLRGIAIDSNGRIVLTGYFTSFSGFSRKSVVRLNPDGSVDTTFNGNNLISSNVALPGIDNSVYTVNITNEGKILLGGKFRVTGQTSFVIKNFIRLNDNGSFDNTFVYNDNLYEDESTVTEIDFQSDDKIIVSAINAPNNAVLRFNTDGSLDTAFFTTMLGAAYTTTVGPDDKVYLGGGIIQTGAGSSFRILVRLNPDGTLDSGFNLYVAPSGSSTVNAVKSIKFQGDKILIGGVIPGYFGQPYGNLVRLNNDGTLDASFITGSGTDGEIRDIEFDTNGRILICGNFTTFNGVLFRRLARLCECELSLTEQTLVKNFLFSNDGFNYNFKSLDTEISSIFFYNSIGAKTKEIININSFDFSIPVDSKNEFQVIKIKFNNGSEEIVKTIN